MDRSLLLAVIEKFSGGPVGIDNLAAATRHLLYLELPTAHDLAEILDRRGVAIRAGFHCAQPLHEQLELSSSARVSVAPYTTHDDLDALFAGLRDARNVFEE